MKTLWIIFAKSFRTTAKSCFVDSKRYFVTITIRTRQSEIGQSILLKKRFKNIGNHVDLRCKSILIGSDLQRFESSDFQQMILNERQSLLERMI